MTNKQISDVEKLQLLLTHWLQHNESHSREYEKWAEVARQGGYSTAAECIEQALGLLAEADKAFEKALLSVGGPAEGHHHHHE